MNAKDHIAVKLSSLTPQVLQSLKQLNFLVFYLEGSKNRPNWGFFVVRRPKRKFNKQQY